MTRNGYAPVADDVPIHSPDEEMEQAFESDDDDNDSTPLTHNSTTSVHRPESHLTRQDSSLYDFEREYDRPPPGSPPPQATTLSHAVGNSNGIIPDPANVERNFPTPSSSRPSFFRRAVGALLPQHYSRLPASDPAEVHGGGMENDGVFSNVLARPSRSSGAQTADNGIQEMSEDAQKDVPPSYNEAQRDAVPPYWETTVHAPVGSSDGLLIDGLPSGTIFSFAWNFLISISFQFVGFMLTYLLHTTHAAKYGSRAGLGVTLIQYGLYSRTSYDDDLFGGGSEDETGETTTRIGSSTGMVRRMWMSSNDEAGHKIVIMSGNMVHDWVSFLLMTIGWFLLLSSLLGFARVKRWERSITTPTPASQPYTAEQIAQDQVLQARLADVFLFDASRHSDAESIESPTSERERQSPRSAVREEEHIRQDLRSLGLI